MNQNLDLLRQKYCRPAVATGKATNSLFPLEKKCEQGRTLLAKAPKTLLPLQEFSPYGLHQTYQDEAAGLELPVFAVFDLEGNHQLTFEITTDSIAPATVPKSLAQSARVVQGVVRSTNDQPQPNAVVYLQDQKSLEVKTYITEADGHYRFGQNTKDRSPRPDPSAPSTAGRNSTLI